MAVSTEACLPSVIHCRYAQLHAKQQAPTTQKAPGPEVIVKKVCADPSVANVRELRRQLGGAWMAWLEGFFKVGGHRALHAAAAQISSNPLYVRAWRVVRGFHV